MEMLHFISSPRHPPNNQYSSDTHSSVVSTMKFSTRVSKGKPYGSKTSGNHDVICRFLLCVLSPALGKSGSRISRGSHGTPHLPFSFCRTECMHLLKPRLLVCCYPNFLLILKNGWMCYFRNNHSFCSGCA